jgi:hypothetical protein
LTGVALHYLHENTQLLRIAEESLFLLKDIFGHPASFVGCVGGSGSGNPTRRLLDYLMSFGFNVSLSRRVIWKSGLGPTAE